MAVFLRNLQNQPVKIVSSNSQKYLTFLNIKAAGFKKLIKPKCLPTKICVPLLRHTDLVIHQ